MIERNGPPTFRLLNNTSTELGIHLNADRNAKESVLYRWYRGRLRDRVPPSVAEWEPKVGVTVRKVRIRKMKTRWDSCSPESKRLRLNTELAKKSVSCLTYALVHEMIHLIESSHNDRFWGLMDRFMPKWRLHRDELNCAPLAHEDWSY